MEHIIVMGNVATGKSHLTKVLQYNLHHKIVLYPEFINDDAFAMEMLRRRFAGTVSALTFQNFIMDKWVENKKLNEGKEGICMYERLPDDAVKVFAKLSLSVPEYAIQKQRLKDLEMLSYKDMNKDNCTWIRYENNFTKDLSPLIETVNSMKTKYVVIEVRSETAFNNYLHRNRREEFYTKDEIEQLQKLYNSFAERQLMEIGCELIEL